MTRLLIIDDDQSFMEILNKLLDINNYQILKAYSAKQAIDLLNDGAVIDIIVCDYKVLEMPSTNLLELLHTSYRHIPIIVLSNENEVTKAVESMRNGAKDYLLKERVDDTLLNTIERVLKQHRKTIQILLKFEAAVKEVLKEDLFEEFTSGSIENHFYLDVANLRVYFDTHSVELTKTEFDILLCLWQAKGEVVTYKDIILTVHNDIVLPEEAKRALSTHISNLRHKLDDIGCKHAILTQRTRGYYLNSKYL